jgi:hypothetical protein
MTAHSSKKHSSSYQTTTPPDAVVLPRDLNHSLQEGVHNTYSADFMRVLQTCEVSAKQQHDLLAHPKNEVGDTC